MLLNEIRESREGDHFEDRQVEDDASQAHSGAHLHQLEPETACRSRERDGCGRLTYLHGDLLLAESFGLRPERQATPATDAASARPHRVAAYTRLVDSERCLMPAPGPNVPAIWYFGPLADEDVLETLERHKASHADTNRA